MLCLVTPEHNTTTIDVMSPPLLFQYHVFVEQFYYQNCSWLFKAACFLKYNCGFSCRD